MCSTAFQEGGVAEVFQTEYLEILKLVGQTLPSRSYLDCQDLYLIRTVDNWDKNDNWCN